MAGHGSERPDDQALNPNRGVSAVTYINRRGGSFSLRSSNTAARGGDGSGAPGRPAMTITNGSRISVGGPAGDASLAKAWRYGDPNSSSAVVRRPPPAEPYNREYGAQR
jgi:hypothetical protein